MGFEELLIKRDYQAQKMRVKQAELYRYLVYKVHNGDNCRLQMVISSRYFLKMEIMFKLASNPRKHFYWYPYKPIIELKPTTCGRSVQKKCSELAASSTKKDRTFEVKMWGTWFSWQWERWCLGWMKVAEGIQQDHQRSMVFNAFRFDHKGNIGWKAMMKLIELRITIW